MSQETEGLLDELVVSARRVASSVISFGGEDNKPFEYLLDNETVV